MTLVNIGGTCNSGFINEYDSLQQLNNVPGSVRSHRRIDPALGRAHDA